MYKDFPIDKLRIGLGTAQFGERYGITGTKGPNLSKVTEILKVAQLKNIQLIDTAPAYKQAEKLLGLTEIANQFKIVTKFEKALDHQTNSENLSFIIDSLKKSINKLQLEKIYGVLIHHLNDLDYDKGNFIKELVSIIRNSQLVSKIGISIYDEKDIDKVLKIFKPDIIQLPISIFDQRLIKSGYIKCLKNLNIEIHARSIFLQGIILQDDNFLLHRSFQHVNKVKKLKSFANEFGCSVKELSMSFVNSIEEIDQLIIGIRSPEQLKNLQKLKIRKIKVEDFSKLNESNIELIDPRKWK